MKQQTFTAPCRGRGWAFDLESSAGCPLIKVMNRRLGIAAWTQVPLATISRSTLSHALRDIRRQVGIHAKRKGA